jgi:RHS repeat-associated protein
MPLVLSCLLSSDLHGSVLSRRAPGSVISYTPYGYSPDTGRSVSFCGYYKEAYGAFALGSGYRAFCPVLLRFVGPDGLSPFGRGGINAYAYGLGNPVNLVDPDGHMPLPVALLKAATGVRRSKAVVGSSVIQLPAGPITAANAGRRPVASIAGQPRVVGLPTGQALPARSLTLGGASAGPHARPVVDSNAPAGASSLSTPPAVRRERMRIGTTEWEWNSSYDSDDSFTAGMDPDTPRGYRQPGAGWRRVQ